MIDFLLIRAGSDSIYGLGPDSFKRAKGIKIENVTYNVPSVEDFILMKLATRRASTEDFQDSFTAMIKNYDLIDWSYLFEHARKLKVETLLESYKNLAQERKKKC